jgi:hypothetical protein
VCVAKAVFSTELPFLVDEKILFWKSGPNLAEDEAVAVDDSIHLCTRGERRVVAGVFG